MTTKAIQHTPGPWEVSRYTNYCGFSIYAPDAGCIAERWWPTVEKDIPIEANARLIAAAPEMLAAIEEWFEYWDDRYDGQPLKDYELKMLNVLKKAKGDL